MHEKLMTPEIKALLISIGSVSIDSSLVPRARSSTAGPGAGTSSIFFRSGKRRVRLSLKEGSPLSIKKVGQEDTVSLFFEGKVLYPNFKAMSKVKKRY